MQVYLIVFFSSRICPRSFSGMEFHWEYSRIWICNGLTFDLRSLFVVLEYFDTSLCETDQAMALGMESGAIPDSALSASSSYNVGNVGPHTAR